MNKDQAQAGLVAAIQFAVESALARDTSTPSHIEDPETLLAAIAPCPRCGSRIDSSLCTLEVSAEWQEKLLAQVLRECVPPRFQPVVRAMMVHLDRCGVAA